jgi:hypothetical protein
MAVPVFGRLRARVHEVALHALLDAAERTIEKTGPPVSQFNLVES